MPGLYVALNGGQSCNAPKHDRDNKFFFTLPQRVTIKQGARLKLDDFQLHATISHTVCSSEFFRLLGTDGKETIASVTTGAIKAKSNSDFVQQMSKICPSDVLILELHDDGIQVSLRSPMQQAKWLIASPGIASVLGVPQKMQISQPSGVVIMQASMNIFRPVSQIALLCHQLESSYMTETANLSFLGAVQTRQIDDKSLESVGMITTSHQPRLVTSSSSSLTHLTFGLINLQTGNMASCLSNVCITCNLFVEE